MGPELKCGLKWAILTKKRKRNELKKPGTNTANVIAGNVFQESIRDAVFRRVKEELNKHTIHCVI